MSSYARLTKLTALSLANESNLGLGFQAPHSYLDLGTFEHVQKEQEEALARLTDGVERILIQGRGTRALKQLNIGHGRWGHKFIFVKDNDGKLKKVMR